MILMTKNINLTNEELELIQGGADPYGKDLMVIILGKWNQY